ncbi:unnamed protein product [Cercopithifilaria johnstoni]|uniref:Uncharacterized protein n=1 Tax=Cercopithifilaria johnstoni TaxID=2874296 RepID=A0A8J2M0F7_9BILA|nr:unnamed protein product [Cercopithifilaria johnstoni]
MLCNFESKCDWMFESPARKYPRDPRHNFKVVVGNREFKPTHYAYFNFTKTREEPAMIISPYYQHLSNQVYYLKLFVELSTKCMISEINGEYMDV